MSNLKRVFLVMAIIGFVLGFSGIVFAEDHGDTGKININTASADELTKLKGVGPRLAAHIVAYREANGLFKTVQDLDLVKGIGPKILADNAAILTVGAPVTPTPVPTPVPKP